MTAALLLGNAEHVSLPGLGHMFHHFAPDAVVAAVHAVMRRAPGTSRRGRERERRVCAGTYGDTLMILAWVIAEGEQDPVVEQGN